MRNLLGLLVLFGMMLSPAFAQEGMMLGCNPGTSECVDDTSFRVCTERAVWGETQYCLLEQQCVNGQCMERLGCQPGARECVDAYSYRVCGSHAVWNPTQYCGSGQTCYNGQCTPSPQCSYHDTRCSPTDSRMLQVCNSQGQWQDWKKCSHGCRSGACMDCRSGDRQCYDNTHYQKC
ncbi:MAG TPA: hypothetical protein PKJ97_02445, partial [Candidatus Bilamarchaeaceae archaeon]|nr:hypothetical protein [Candidatus Bilamarchaeaceae archaeon]